MVNFRDSPALQAETDFETDKAVDLAQPEEADEEYQHGDEGQHDVAEHRLGRLAHVAVGQDEHDVARDEDNYLVERFHDVAHGLLVAGPVAHEHQDLEHGGLDEQECLGCWTPRQVQRHEDEDEASEQEDGAQLQADERPVLQIQEQLLKVREPSRLVPFQLDLTRFAVLFWLFFGVRMTLLRIILIGLCLLATLRLIALH